MPCHASTIINTIIVNIGNLDLLHLAMLSFAMMGAALCSPHIAVIVDTSTLDLMVLVNALVDAAMLRLTMIALGPNVTVVEPAAFVHNTLRRYTWLVNHA